MAGSIPKSNGFRTSKSGDGERLETAVCDGPSATVFSEPPNREGPEGASAQLPAWCVRVRTPGEGPTDAA